MPSQPEVSGGWHVHHHELDAAAFHSVEVEVPVARSVWTSHPSRPAVVLGSTQDPTLVDRDAAARLGVDVVKRRSGGGAVLVVPGEVCWIDFVIGRPDPRWDDDVGRAMYWVGEVWRAALEDLGVEAEVHRGPMIRTAWSDVICFAGLGPGELVGDGGAKVVGISQRRTRDWARFQTAALVRWEPDVLIELLAADEPGDQADLARAASGLGRTVGELEAAVLRNLPPG